MYCINLCLEVIFATKQTISQNDYSAKTSFEQHSHNNSPNLHTKILEQNIREQKIPIFLTKQRALSNKIVRNFLKFKFNVRWKAINE